MQEALELLESKGDGWIINKMDARPVSLLKAPVYAYLSDSTTARELYEEAREELERRIEDEPKDPRFQSSLGLAYAGLGRHEEAIQHGKLAVELLPVSEDAFYGIEYEYDLAIIYITIGEYEAGLNHLKRLLSIHSWISPSFLEMDIRLFKAWTDPTFRDDILGQ